MKEITLLPFLAGLAVGASCLFFCFPFFVPFLLAEERKRKEHLFLILRFLFGRLLGYLSFGAFFGFLGEKLNQNFLNLIFLFALMVLSLILIFYSFSFFKEENFFCQRIRKSETKIPILMGFFSGINLCPPFLVSLTYIFTLHNFLNGIIYFFFFFLGTALYFFPLYFLGFLNKFKEFQLMAKISGIIVGILFFSYGVYNFISGISLSHF